jgi:histidine triad (HIT) family protein
MNDCVFCKIVAKEIPSKAVYEDDFVYAFNDLNPSAPSHVLVIPKKHIASLATATEGEVDVLGHILNGCAQAARSVGIEKEGYRTVINTNRAAGQEVFHIHAHVLGGRDFSWPPG